MTALQWKHWRAPALLATSLIALSTACGGGELSSTPTSAPAQAPGVQVQLRSVVTTSDRLYTAADFTAAGLKSGKAYDVTGLPGATAAALMFFQQKDIEVRFFPSHDVAVSQGIPVAREIVGPDAVLTGERLTWDAGINDQRACQPGNLGGGRDCTRQPKYAGFVTHGNVIIFCEGRDPEESRARCESVTGLLPK